MNDTEFLNNLNRSLEEEALLMKELQQSPEGIALKSTRDEMLAFLKTITKGEGIGSILAIERQLLANDLACNLDDEEVVTGLKAALAELDRAESCLSLVFDPDKYRDVDTSHGPKNRKGKVPNDVVRCFFTSHTARLNNAAKTRMSNEEMKIVQERRRMTRRGEKLYIIQQHRALGLEPPEQAKVKGLGR